MNSKPHDSNKLGLELRSECWEARVCMRVEKSREARVCLILYGFVWEFSQLSRPGQTKQQLYESWWELTSDSSHESFLNFQVLFKREQELHESWWELTSKSLDESFPVYFPPPIKGAWRLTDIIREKEMSVSTKFSG